MILGGAANVLADWPRAASAQQAGKTARVGLLFNGLKTPLSAAGYPAFVDELRRQGFVEGRNLVIEQRVHGQDSSDTNKFYADAADLARSKVDVLATFGSEVFIRAAVAASKTIPIVMLAINYDPIERGYVKSLARPGGNITGVTFRQPELAGKQIELLREAFPGHTRLAALYDTESAEQFSAAEIAAKSMHLQLVPVKLANSPYDFTSAFKAAADGRAQMVLVLSSGFFTAHRAQIAELAIQHRLPTMFIFKTYVQAGGLMSYGVDFLPAFRRVADYVGKILNGAKPADLPVEQVSTFELVVNLKTAKAIGVELPTSILLRANSVIE
jgi:putative ABC transport system substrate-binding protein